MLYLYLKLKLLILRRIFKEIRFFYGIIILFFFVLLSAVMIKIENHWVVPVTCILILGYYNNSRKDRNFLKLLTNHSTMLLTQEYFVLSLPFICIELVRRNFLDSLGIILVVFILPHMKEIKTTYIPVKLQFLYKGDLEYIRMFRQCFWVYILLLLFSIMGLLNNNVKIPKACILIWGLLETTGYADLPNKLYLLKFRNFKTFCNFYIKSSLWNAGLFLLPFIIMLLIYHCEMESVLFTLIAYINTIFYMLGMNLLRQLTSSSIFLIILQAILLLPFYIFACFLPYLLLVEITFLILLSYLVYKNINYLWNK